MDEAFIKILADKQNLDIEKTQHYAEKLTSCITTLLCEGKAVSVPGFGTLKPSKKEEYVAIEPSTGKNILYPPSVDVTFTAGARLKKNI